MFVVDLAELRKGEVLLRERIGPDDPILEGVSDAYRSPVELQIRARRAGESVWVEVRLETVLSLSCRRCLEDVERKTDARFDLVYQEGADESDGEVYPLDEHVGRIDLPPAIREHLILQVPRFVTCEEACRGLCAQCGINLNTGQCECEPEEGEGPWDALKNIRFD